jgi:hypothetical protein
MLTTHKQTPIDDSPIELRSLVFLIIFLISLTNLLGKMDFKLISRAIVSCYYSWRIKAIFILFSGHFFLEL